MQVKWSEQAVSEAEGIVNYIAGHNIAAALEMDDLIRQSVLILEKMPGAGRYGRVAHTRELVIHKNYVVIYEIAAEYVLILNVKHTGQKYP
ncbi:type II toxin-antitoxin system RelE/ParE family toxin [Neisseria sp. WLZKY-1]|jgi:addiction module toxin, relE/stbE family|uniref:type II toxin-antitoxin system RelE/ParE family toxin n=1 Tax=Neisseria sp. WLZKY-1 TaxID=3390377 RepID=UPI00397C30CF